MKSFKQYIKSYMYDLSSLNESLLDDEDEIASNDEVLIIQYLNKYYKFNFGEPGSPRGLNPNYVLENGVVHVYGHVHITDKSIKTLTNGLFKFGVVTGSFHCSNCPNLESLEGAPQFVGKSFDCHNCSSLKSLEGGPQYVGEKSSRSTNQWNGCQYDCSGTAITSLKGTPRGYIEHTGGYNTYKGVDGATYANVHIHNCPNLTTIDWNIKKQYGNLHIQNCPNLRDLKGMPQKIYGELWINLCNSLKSLDGGPSYVSDEININSCNNFKSFGKCLDPKFKYKKLKIYCVELPNFDSFEGIPSQIYYFSIKSCPSLKTLKDAPTEFLSCLIKSCPNLKDLGGWDPKSKDIVISPDMKDFQRALESKGLKFRYYR